jgi:osmotically-inducible protein OsmY
MKTFLVLLIGLALGAAGAWLFVTYRDTPAMRNLQQRVGNTTADVRGAVSNKLDGVRLRPADIQEELAHTGQVVRRAASDMGRAVADATADARTTAAIKARYVADKRLSALRISVNCTEGRVTLSGTVSNMEDISHAMLLAMESDGVREVVSTLQVKK